MEVFRSKDSLDSWVMRSGEALIILDKDLRRTMMSILTSRGLGFVRTTDLWIMQ